MEGPEEEARERAEEKTKKKDLDECSGNNRV
jgi:hypothetical protein